VSPADKRKLESVCRDDGDFRIDVNILREALAAVEENERLRSDRELLLQAALWSLSHTVHDGLQFYFSRLRDAVDKVARSPQERTAAKPDVTTD
jgi:hypothetical protein